jgi:hypothetical protein
VFDRRAPRALQAQAQAGALFPIGVMPRVLEWVAKFTPLTHALALMRYGFIDMRVFARSAVK